MRLLSPPRQRPRDRVQTESDKKPTAAPMKLPAPLAGWLENSPLAAGQATGARVMENMFPTTQGVRVRGGSTKTATVGARCRSMFTYETASASKLFAATASAVYDISAMNPASVPSAAISGLASGYFSTAQIGTAGGEYLYAVNGTDSARLYDGATWTTVNGASTPAITGVTTSTLSFVWKHKNRLWFVQKDTKKAWYLPVDSIGGAAVSLDLAGVFQKGGYLQFGATWSQDAGDGMDDRQVFVSSEGEVAIYQGSDPSDANNWAMVGLYSMSPPRGTNCHIKAGGDLIIGTDEGAVPLSAIMNKDPAALASSAVSANIETSWRKFAKSWDGVQPWEMIKWPRENMLLLSIPHDLHTCFAANLKTGAWAKFIGWDVQCMALFNDALYFADRSGYIYAAELGGTDNGAAYTARLSYMPTDLGNPTSIKAIGLMRGTFQAIGAPTVQLSMTSNFDVTFPDLPVATVTTAGTGALWDVGLWDTALWDDDGLNDYIVKPTYSTGWVGVGYSGVEVAPQVQLVISGAGRPNIELVQLELLAEAGGAVV